MDIEKIENKDKSKIHSISNMEPEPNNNKLMSNNSFSAASLYPTAAEWKKLRWVTTERLNKMVDNEQFQSHSIGEHLLYQERIPLSILVYSPPSGIHPSFHEAYNVFHSQPLLVKESIIGNLFGPLWSTHWFKLTVEIPETHLIWNSNNECLLYDENGDILQGLTGGNGYDKRHCYHLWSDYKKAAKSSSQLVLYLEMSCNGMFGAGNQDMIDEPDPQRTYRLDQAEIAIFNKEAWNLLFDMRVMKSLALNLPPESRKAAQALVKANDMLNTFNCHNTESWAKVQSMAQQFFEQHNGNSPMQVYLTGHCHIDTAWLWPYRETRRKTARSWSSQLELIKQYPQYIFSVSQMQQFDWMKEDYPHLYHKILANIKEGHFFPVGGCWVEMDCNLPSGESLVRQLLYGQHFCQSEWGQRCTVAWIPDTFGYCSQLPQLFSNAGMPFFLTQKLSWNMINRFPHHSFHWEGLDGTRVLTHFPPSDSYNSMVNASELVHLMNNYRQKAVSSVSLMLFGHGDGGGGPQKDHLERLQRLKDIDGLPKLQCATPLHFFQKLSEESKSLPIWYFELHRGTLTSQSMLKYLNRKCELSLHNLEWIYSLLSLYSSNTSINKSFSKTNINDGHKQISSLWKTILLNQFHDVLPGSCIGIVAKEAESLYSNVLQQSQNLISKYFSEFFSLFYHPSPQTTSSPSTKIVVNTLSFFRHDELIMIPKDTLENQEKDSILFSQTTWDNKYLALCSCIPCGYSLFSHPSSPIPFIEVHQEKNQYIMENSQVKIYFDTNGHLISFYDKIHKRPIISPGEYGNDLMIYEDCPLYWDSWDVEIYHREKPLSLVHCIFSSIVENGPLRVSLMFQFTIGYHSTLQQIVSLSCNNQNLEFDNYVKWSEQHLFLKVEFPLHIHSTTTIYETQYGLVYRNNHINTTRELAMFEVSAHRFASIVEPNYGIALFNDSKYGYSCHRNRLCLSILRSPQRPDPQCDHHDKHHFRYSLYPFAGSIVTAQIVQKALSFNQPLLFFLSPSLSPSFQSFFWCEPDQIIIDTIKTPEPLTTAKPLGSLILRLYEPYGCHVNTMLFTYLPLLHAYQCNILEDTINEILIESTVNSKNYQVSLSFSPFKVITLKLEFKI